MGFLQRLKLVFRPLRLEDPEFGPLRFQYVPNAPERSYWEAEWLFPPLGYPISVALPGDRNGPTAAGRAFFLSRAPQLDGILQRARPRLEEVFRERLERPLAADLWQDLELAGFGVEDPSASPPVWDVAFETRGEKWLGITIPMIGDAAGEALVDT